MPEKLMTPKQVHENYGLAVQTLANWRWQGVGPAYIKTTPAANGRVRYRPTAVEQWLDSQTVETGGAAA